MKRFMLCIVVMLLCVGSGVPQSRRKGTSSSVKQSGSKLPSELMKNIINDYSYLGDVKDIISGAFDGREAEYTRDWRVERIDLNKDKILDFIIYPYGTPFSGNHSGIVLIYQKTSTGYRNLTERSDPLNWADSHSAPPINIVVGKSYTNGFVDLYEILDSTTKCNRLIFEEYLIRCSIA